MVTLVHNIWLLSPNPIGACVADMSLFIFIKEMSTCPYPLTKLSYYTHQIQSYPIPGWKPPLKNLLLLLMPSYSHHCIPLITIAILTLAGNMEKRGRRKKSQMVFSQHYLALCGSGLSHHREEIAGSLPLESIMNSLGGINNFTSPTERGMRSYLHYASAQSQAISLKREQQADCSAPAQME